MDRKTHEVRQLLDGSWRVYYRDRLIAQHGRTPLREARSARGPHKKSLKGVRETLWIYLASKTWRGSLSLGSQGGVLARQ